MWYRYEDDGIITVGQVASMPRQFSEKSIEEIILSKDKRGISALRESLPANYCTEAADYVLQRPGTVLIATGFYILSGATVETDGPPGR